MYCKTAVTGLVAVPLEEVVFIVVLALVVMGCPICHDEVIGCETLFSFYAASRQILVTSVRNIFLDSAETDINFCYICHNFVDSM